VIDGCNPGIRRFFLLLAADRRRELDRFLTGSIVCFTPTDLESIMRTLLNRLRRWQRMRQFERDLAEELETHRLLRQSQLEDAGLATREAEAESRRALGNVRLAREDAREVWVLRWLDEALRDLRHGSRLLLRNPGFSMMAVASLAIGIGANTAIFTLIDAVILRPLPVDAPQQLIVLERINTRGERSNLSYAIFSALRTPDAALSGAFAALDGTYRLEMGRAGRADTETVRVQAVSGEYFQVLGVRPALGRALTSDDDRLGAPEPVAVLSHGCWQRRFGSDPSVLGQRITLKGESVTIIGVAPPQFFGESVGRAPEVWVPLTLEALLGQPGLLTDPRVGWLRAMGRLRPGVSLAQAQESVNLRLAALKLDGGPTGQSLRQVSGIGIEPGSRGLPDTRTKFSRQLGILMAVVAVVLMIACANVANLLLVRGAARSRETAVRLAIGAGRGRLIRQFLTESLLLGAIGGAVGLLVAGWGSQVLLVLASNPSSRLAIDVTPDARILAFTCAVSLATVLLFGFAPAYATARPEIRTGNRSTLMLPRALVVAQVALSLLLMAGAGLFVQTVTNLRSVDLGFAPDGILQTSINPQQAGYPPEQFPEVYRRVLDRVRDAPGLLSVSMSSSGFRTGASRTCCIAIRGHIPEPGEEREVQTMSVTTGYFETMGIPITRGRAFDTRDVDDGDAPKLAIVNEAMVRRFFGGRAAVGERFGWGNPPSAKYDIEIVGIARDAIYGDLRTGSTPLIYFPASAARYLIVRAALPTGQATAMVKSGVQSIDRRLEVDVRTVPELRDHALLLERMVAALSGFFGVVALLLAGIGLYGTVAYVVTRRTKEIAIRVALGAQRGRVVREVFGETMGLALAGAVLGGCAALLGTRLLSSLLFGVSPEDPATLGMSILLLVSVAALAGAIPARRAATIEPIEALRQD
jgi:predicted permease